MSPAILLISMIVVSGAGGIIGAWVVSRFEKKGIEKFEDLNVAPTYKAPLFFTKSTKKKPKVNDDKAAWMIENGREKTS
jgi:hypothetical protein